MARQENRCIVGLRNWLTNEAIGKKTPPKVISYCFLVPLLAHQGKNDCTEAPNMKIIQQHWFTIWQLDDTHPGYRGWYFFLRALTILFTYLVLDRMLMAMTNLPMERYWEPVIFIAFLKYFFSSKFVILSLPFLLLLIILRKSMTQSWAAINNGKVVRLIVMLVAGMLAWVYATLDFNFYFNQAYIADRLLLLALLPLIFWRPVFVLSFLFVLLSFIGQSEVLVGFSWAAPFLPIRILVLFSAFYLLFLWTNKFLIKDFVMFTCSLVAAHYWSSGWGKLNWEWIANDRIFLLLPATYANGWLSFFDPETIGSITQTLLHLNGPMKIVVLLLEVGGCLFFLHRHASRFFLTGWLMMHLGIFLVSGICFWMWGTLVAGLLLVFFKNNGLAELPVFTKKHLLVSFLLIISGGYWCRPVKLAWYDVPVSYTYRMEATMDNGQRKQLPPGFFGAFDYQFTLSGFSYLSKEATLPVVWGASGVETAKVLDRVNSASEVFVVEKSNGRAGFNESQAIAFDHFMKTYIGNWNKRPSAKTAFSYFKPPLLLWTFPKAPSFDEFPAIQKIRVIQVTSFYHEGKYEEIRALPVREISIP